jgi:predicted MFS family arabinose efflux permease
MRSNLSEPIGVRAVLSVPDRWLMLSVLFVARTAIAYQFQTIASVGPLLVDSLAIDFAWLGTLIGLHMLPGVVFALPGGVLGQRFGAKRVVLIGLMLMAVGGLLTATDSFLVVASGRLISGLGAVLLNVLMTKMVMDWFAGHEIVPAMAMFVTSWPLGLAIGLLTLPPLATAYGWSAAMYAAVLVTLGSLGLVALIYRDPTVSATAEVNLRMRLSRQEWLLVLLAGTAWATYNAGYIVLVSFLPELFTARGYLLPEASRIVSLLGWVVALSVVFAGYLAAYIRRPNLLMFGGFAVVALAAGVLPFMSNLALVFGIIVLAIGLPGGLIMALPAEALRPENRAAGMGLYYMCYYVGMALLPAGAGMARDISGSLSAPALFASAMMIAAGAALIGFRWTQRFSMVN